jgi:hypothetical protein
MTEALHMWVIYDHPTDVPNHWVIRRQKVFAGIIQISLVAYLFTSLEEAHKWLAKFDGLTRIQGPGDDPDPKIHEVWV